MQTALLCLCLLSMAISIPVPPPPLPGRAGGNCMGQHRILLKGCNSNHGFYVFEYVYSLLTRSNQTQIEKEEANSQNTGPVRPLGEDDARRGPTEDGAAPDQGSDGGTEVMENETGFKTENRSITSAGGDARGPRPGTSTRARSGVSIVGPTPASSEGSGDLDLVVEADGGVSILPHGGQPGGAVVGNRSGIRSGDGDDGAPVWVPIEGAVAAGREKALTTGGAGDEGSGEATGEATIPGRGQEAAVQGAGTGGAALSSVTEKTEDFQVNAKGVDEYAYIPESGSTTITQGKVGSTSITQISPNADDKVNIFTGRANIRVGEEEIPLASVTVGSEDDSVLTMGTSSPMPRLGVTTERDGNDDDSNPVRGQPEGPATTATPSHGDRVTSSPADSRPTGDDEDGATTVGDGEGPVAPSPWRVSGGDVTVPTGAGGRGDNDKESRGEGQRFRGRLGRPVVTTSPQEGDKEADPAERASIDVGTTVASRGTSEGDCTTALGTNSGHEAGGSTVTGRGRSGEAGLATPQPRGDSQPGAGAKVQLGGVGLKEPPRVEKAPSPRQKAGGQASSNTQARAGSSGSDAGGRLRAAEVGGSTPLQVGRAGGSAVAGEGRERDRGGEVGVTAAGEGQERGRAGKAGVMAVGAGGSRLPVHRGRRPGATAPGAFAALGRSRQVDQVRRADELHVRERAFYTLGGARGGPHGPYTGLRSADSSQSSEGEQGSDSRQVGRRPLGWGAPGYPHSRWSRGAL